MVEGKLVAQETAGTRALERARGHVAERAWGPAHEELLMADAQGLLDADGLELLGQVARLAGDDGRSQDAMARAHRAHRDAGADDRAVSCAFWLGMQLINLGDMARGGGWIGRAQRLAASLPADGPHAGYLELPGALQALSQGDAGAALDAFRRAHAAGRRHADPDLEALGLLGRGQALVALGRAEEGMAALDEVMVSVTTEEVSPIVAGIVYCAVIEACHRAWELQRARIWTTALGVWCDDQPDLVPFRGQCMIHRAQVLRLQGEWPDAMAHVEEARRRFSEPPIDMAVGAAYYEQAELHRLRGELDAAEEAYASASEWGHAPQPGQALLRLAQGRTADAVAAIRRVDAETSGDLPRARVLPAMVEILLAAGQVDAARAAADELAVVAEQRSVPQLDATAAQASGAVLLAEDRWGDALEQLRRAMVTWLDLRVPHEAARARILMARACRALGDADTAAVELAAARRACEQLGASPQLAVIDSLALGTGPRQRPAGLTEREAEVLVQVATGKTNRQVAQELHISEKTVARHLSNIFTKLDLSSRAAATAWAYEHDLV